MKLTHELCNHFFENLDINTKRALVLIFSEKAAAETRHPVWPEDMIHQAAIVAEESGELIRAVLNYVQGKKRYYEIHHEAKQTGAMALRMLVNLPEMKLPGGKKETEPNYQRNKRYSNG